MKRLTQEEINKVLENHKHWLAADCDKWENMQADFSYCDLHNANLYGANLHNANLYGANLHNADLRNANLSNAYLSNANLCNADLCYADLRNANLHNANLHNAHLSNANLDNADLHNAHLSNANLDNAKNFPYFPMVCPEEGDFIGWKKAGNKIIKLHIPEDALRSSATTRKCRCSKAEVIEIYYLDGTIAEERQVASDRDSSFFYEVGKTVEVKDFDKNRWKECTRGIHFFLNRQEAINYS